MIDIDKNLTTFGNYETITIRISNPTNGEILEALFPDLAPEEFDSEWWSKPYKSNKEKTE